LSSRLHAAGKGKKVNSMQERNAKRAFIFASFVAIVLGTQAVAQTSGSAPSQTIAVDDRDRILIMQYIAKERIEPTKLKEMPIVGAPLPLNVELKPVPSIWGAGLTKYSYIYSAGRVYIIDPSNYTVVKEIN
jgi:hypothetical protein